MSDLVVRGRCPEHALTYCEPCGWITVAEVRALRAEVERLRAGDVIRLEEAPCAGPRMPVGFQWAGDLVAGLADVVRAWIGGRA